MKYYAVSDVHGYYTRLRSTLEEAGFFTDIEPRKLILCGELLVQCLYEVKDGDAPKIASGMSHHYYNKTRDTLLQISEMDEKDACEHPMTLAKRVV